jgi:uncharacterized membrane protein
MSDTSFGTPTPQAALDAKLRNTVLIVHILYAVALVTGGLGAIVGVVLAYIRRPEVTATIWESHLTYAIRTFWIGLALTAAGSVLSLVVVGVAVLLFAGIWYIVRVVKAFVLWSDGKPIPDPRAFF